MIDTTEAAYRLTYQPDGTSITVRENLVDILARELLGPIRGPQEVLPFSPRSQYLVGHLAPVKLTGAALIDDNAVQARANAEALAEGGGVPAYAADETTPRPRPRTQAGPDDPGINGFTVSGATRSGVVHHHRVMDNLRDRREREVTKAGRTIASAIAVISSRLHRACPGATTANDRASAASLRRLS